jgi:hypothetical protein
VAGISTEHLAELIEQSNRRQDEANERVADELRELRREFHDFRVDVAQRMGQIQASLEGFRGRTETGFKVAAWAVTLAIGVALSLVASVITGTWYAAKLDSRVQHLESRAAADPGAKGAR